MKIITCTDRVTVLDFKDSDGCTLENPIVINTYSGTIEVRQEDRYIILPNQCIPEFIKALKSLKLTP